MQYTIEQVKPTGEPDKGYGIPYFVKFEGDERVAQAQKKSAPNVGDTWDGDIVADKYSKTGFKFKKAPFVPGQGGAAQSTTSTRSGSSFTKSTYKDNSDGQRQGMCFNNAANFVNALATPEMTDTDWANMVFAYAKALYNLGDLNAPEKTQEDTVAPVTDAPVNLDNVAAFFGAEAPKAK